MASKDYLEQSRADDLESSYNSQNKLSPIPLNSCDNESHRSFTIGDGAAPLIGPIENGFTFNITYIPCSEVPMDSTAILSDNNSFTDTKSQGKIILSGLFGSVFNYKAEFIINFSGFISEYLFPTSCN